jgi:hypothetical protein
MRLLPVVAAFTVALSFVEGAMAQGGGGGGRGRGRPEEITNRVGAFFTDVAGPATDGDKVADLGTIDLVRTAVGAGQPTVLYLYDSGDDEEVRSQFDRAVFAGDELGIELRCFHCGRIDLAKESSLKAKYGKQAPLFVAFDAKGKPAELSMAGYKASASGLGKLLEKQGAGTVKPSMAAFAKSYGDLVRDLEQVIAKKKQAEQKQARAGGDENKRKEADKDLKEAEAEQQKLLDKEKDLLAKNRLPERSDKAVRLGGRGFGRGPEGGDGGRPTGTGRGTGRGTGAGGGGGGGGGGD